MRIPALITVRSASTRLPRKCHLPFGERTVIEHVVHRTQHYGLEPILCTTVERDDDAIEAVAKAMGAKCFRGSVRHKLKRWRDACREFRLQAFHTVDADDPFFDGDLVKESFALLAKGNDAVYPTESSAAGFASVGFSLTAALVEKACADLPEDADTEMMWAFLEKVPGLRMAKLAEPVPPPSARLTLDYEEDYWLLRTVMRVLGPDCTGQQIRQLFERNPDLHKMNWFRNQQWKSAQDERVAQAGRS